jgi:hypothetical protein
MPYQRGGQRLLTLADEFGFDVVRTTRGGGHVLLVHRRTQRLACLPLNVAERGRNFDNYRSALRRAAEMFIRSEKSHSPAPKRPTGEATERAERIATRLDNARHLRALKAIEQRDRTTAFYARLMGSGFTG